MGPPHPFAPVPPRREVAREPASRAEGNGSLVFPKRSVSVPSACSAGPLAHEVWLRRGFQRLGVNLSLHGRRDPWEKETEGSANEAADVPFGITNGKFQISNLRCEICNLRFRAERGRSIGRSRRRAPRRRSPFGDLPAAPKAIGLCFFRSVRS